MELIMRTPNLDWLLLTKRPQNFKGRMNAALKRILKATGGEPCNEADFIDGWVNKCDTIPANVWIGATVENQARADERIPHLLSIPAKVRFLSCEPLLGPLDIEEHLEDQLDGGYVLGSAPIHWVICGGESGTHARAMHPEWARSLRDQCSAAGVPFFFKQWGEWLPGCQYREGDRERYREKAQHSFCHDHHSWWVGKKLAGRMLDDRTHDEFPQVERRPA
jgi:protein gp37